MNKKSQSNLRKIALSVFSLSALLGCSLPSSASASDGNVNVKFWSADTINKVVRDRGYDYYASIATDAKLSYRMAKGEYESAQIIMTPETDISSYDVSISEIKDSAGHQIDNVTIYAQKYVHVEGVYDTATYEKPGYFPDPLLKFEAYKKYHENQVKAGENQAVYVSIETSIDQAPGTYTGAFTITIGGVDHTFPVSVEVLPVAISETTHSKSIFLNHWNYQFQELNGSQEMLDAYTDACIDYRLGNDRVVIDHDNADTYIDYAVEKAFEYLQNDRLPTVCIPYKTVYSALYQTNIFDVETMKDYIRAYYEKSMEENFNMFSKSAFYLGMIDEPEENEIIPQCITVMSLYNQTIKEIADELDQVATSHPMHDELIASIRNLQNIVTNKYNSELDGYVDSWCPKVDAYDRQYDRDLYHDQAEKWWYTCVYPRAPYPTYHTEDTLSSARLLSWMQADYDVAGNLYWSTNNYAKMTASGTFQTIEDAYDSAEHSSNINGDGYLFYPGGQYGLDEPVPSIRIEAIRDGLEEYEIFYDLKTQARNYGFADSGLNDLLSYSLYYGTKVHANNADMRKIRDELLDFYVANQNGSEFNVVDYENKYDGKVALSFFAKKDATVSVNGKTLSPSYSVTGGNVYTYEQNLDQASNTMSISVTYEGKTATVTHDFGGKTEVKDAETMQNGFSKYNASVTATIVDGSEISEELPYNILKMDISAPHDAKQSIKYTPSFLNEIDADSSGFSIEVYNPTDENIEFSIGARYEKRTTDSYLVQNEILKPGLNRIYVSTSRVNFSSTGSIKYLMIVTGNSDSTEEEAKTLYFGHFSVMER